MATADRAVSALSRFTDVSAAFVFGSQVDGQPTEESDIDVAAFISEADNWDILERARVASLVQAEVGDDVELHFFASSRLEHPDPASFAAYVMKHGVPIDVAVAGHVAEDEAGYGTPDADS